MSKPILCLDFDGVIHSYKSGWQGADKIPDYPVPGALAFMLEAIDHFTVVIYSSRSHQDGGIEAMKRWLYNRARYEFGSVDTTETLLANIGFPTHKPSAFVTIDDRAITFTGEWPSIETLQNFKPWNKK